MRSTLPPTGIQSVANEVNSKLCSVLMHETTVDFCCSKANDSVCRLLCLSALLYSLWLIYLVIGHFSIYCHGSKVEAKLRKTNQFLDCTLASLIRQLTQDRSSVGYNYLFAYKKITKYLVTLQQLIQNLVGQAHTLSPNWKWKFNPNIFNT